MLTASGKRAATGKREFLKQAAQIEGIYVPSLYLVEYKADGTILKLQPLVPEAKAVIHRRMVDVMPPPPLKPVVPFVEVVQDRAAIEIQRGCSRGCRFCQASSIYRPVRERPQDEVIESVGQLLENCGYDEVSLVSLSTSDYPDIDKLVTALAKLYPNVTFSLPSLRIAASSIQLMEISAFRAQNRVDLRSRSGQRKAPACYQQDYT